MKNSSPLTKKSFGTGGSVIVEKCQICGSSNLKDVVFIGFLPPVNSMPKIGSKPKEETSYPALFLTCPVCGLFQIGLIVDPKILFPPEYPYTSGTTKILRENFAQLFIETRKIVELTKQDLIVDIGSNDGTLLGNFSHYCRVQGIEPSDTGNLAKAKGIPTFIQFFNEASVRQVKTKLGRAKIITATNVFAHIEDIHSVMRNVLNLLDKNGVFITEFHYVYSLIQTLQYDTIYHEHLRYYSLSSLTFLFKQYGLSIFHAKKISTHGGSIRVYAARDCDKYKKHVSVSKLLEYEKNYDFNSERLMKFKRDITLSKLKLLSLLREIKQSKKKIYGVGAPSRASTLIHFVGLDENVIDSVVEISGSYKIGKYMPGTRIPVIDESWLFKKQPEYALLFSWHIAKELIGKLKKRGYRGKFIIPLPTPLVV